MPRDRAACHRPDLEGTIRAFSHRKLGVHTRSVLQTRPCRYAEAARACCGLRASDLSDKGGASGGGKSGDGGGGASGDGGDGGGRECNGGDLSGLAICQVYDSSPALCSYARVSVNTAVYHIDDV